MWRISAWAMNVPTQARINGIRLVSLPFSSDPVIQDEHGRMTYHNPYRCSVNSYGAARPILR